MNYKKVSEITEKHTKLVVTDYISKKQYFADSEVEGWLIVSDDKGNKVYHLYRRWHDGNAINEPVIMLDEELTGEALKIAIETMLSEAEIQCRTGENKEILSEIKSLFE